GGAQPRAGLRRDGTRVRPAELRHQPGDPDRGRAADGGRARAYSVRPPSRSLRKSLKTGAAGKLSPTTTASTTTMMMTTRAVRLFGVGVSARPRLRMWPVNEPDCSSWLGC